MTVGTRTRAGRLRLVARRDIARRAAGLLRTKEEVMERERVRLEGHATRERAEWEVACAAATTELVRARMLGATAEVLQPRTSRPASVAPAWQSSMGIVYPGEVTCEAGERPVVSSTAALRPAADAYRAALLVAARCAAATTAVRRLDAELATTRRRRRAIEDHLVPMLDATIGELDLHLDELDRDEAMRVRLAASRKEVSR